MFSFKTQEIKPDELNLNDQEALIPVGHYYKVSFCN